MFCDRLKEIRTKAGLSQLELAKKLFVTQQAVARWENNKNTPNPETLSKIADILNVSVDYLVGHIEAEKTPVPKDGNGQETSGNVVRVRGSDGSFYERKLSDDQRKLLVQMLDNLKPVEDENI